MTATTSTVSTVLRGARGARGAREIPRAPRPAISRGPIAASERIERRGPVPPDRALWYLARTPRSGAGEGDPVYERAEGLTGRVGVGLDLAALGVRDGEVDPRVGHAAQEEPVVAVRGAVVEDLGRHLHAARIEEPEVAVVPVQGHRVGGAVGGRRLPVGGHLEAAVVEAEVVAARHAGGGGLERSEVAGGGTRPPDGALIGGHAGARARAGRGRIAGVDRRAAGEEGEGRGGTAVPGQGAEPGIERARRRPHLVMVGRRGAGAARAVADQVVGGFEAAAAVRAQRGGV